jgi:hydroxymethylpyrimidine pyrophosphatase-like HAD family hydrolase
VLRDPGQEELKQFLKRLIKGGRQFLLVTGPFPPEVTLV